MGVVHHAVYPVWFESGRTEFSHARQFPYRKIEEAGLAMAVADLKVRFRKPARYDEMITVRTWISKSKPKLVQFSYEVRNESGEIVADGHTVHMVVDMQTFRPSPMPADIHIHFPVWEQA